MFVAGLSVCLGSVQAKVCQPSQGKLLQSPALARWIPKERAPMWNSAPLATAAARALTAAAHGHLKIV